MGAAPILSIFKNGEPLKTQKVEEGEVLLGRDEGCVIRLEDKVISRKHALLKKLDNEGQFQIEKKSSFGELKVNGEDKTSAIIKAGDVIEIGPYLFKLEVEKQSQSMKSVQPQPVVAAPVVPQAQPDMAPNLQLEPMELPPENIPASESPTPQMEVQPQEGNAEFEAPSLMLGGQSGGESLQSPNILENNLELNATSASPSIEIDENEKTKLNPQAEVKAFLHFSPGAANTEMFEIAQPSIKIGRGSDCDIVLSDKKASREHAVLRSVGPKYFLKDLGSSNGIWLNGVKMPPASEHELSSDDTIRIGDCEFKFKAKLKENQRFESLPVEEAIPFQNSPLQAHPLEQGGMMGGSEIPVMPGMPGMQGIPGISGIAGVGSASTGKQSLLEKFKQMEPRRRMIYIVAVLGGLFLLLPDEDTKKPSTPKPAVTSTTSAAQNPLAKAVKTFESLSPEQKKFVESQHQIGFEFYKNKDYDKALFEIRKIFEIIPEYKDSKEIERYALEGKAKLEAIQEEKKRKEEEEKIKARISQLEEEIQSKMDKKEYEPVKDLMSEILSIDPDNAKVAEWKKIMQQYEEEKRLEQQQKDVEQQIHNKAKAIFQEGLYYQKHKRYHEAIRTFAKIKDIGTSDKGLVAAASREIQNSRSQIAALRDPILAEAKQREEASELAKAYHLYEKAAKVDPPHPVAYAAMNRIRKFLHDKAKNAYTEAVLAESYSDFLLAKKKFEEVIQTAPEDDVYHQRAKRKLGHYKGKDGVFHVTD